MSARIFVEPDVGHVRAERDDALQSLPLERELPNGMDVQPDVASVRRDELPMTKAYGRKPS
jgi:hypothetical protein